MIDGSGEACYAYPEMRIKLRPFAWSRVAVLIWASVWMLVVPLFHVHPDTDHHHGEAGHIHGGTIHTVWSQDLDCEFDNPQHVDQTRTSTQDGLPSVAQSPHAGDGHSELSFSVLYDSTDRKSLKPFFAMALGYSPAVVSDGEWYARIHRYTAPVPRFMPFAQAISSRAPPSLFL